MALFFIPLVGKIDATFDQLTTHRWILVGIVTAVIGAIANVGQRDAEIVITLESRLRAVSSTGIPRRTILLIAHVAAISRSVATKIRRDAVTAVALEALALQDRESHKSRISYIANYHLTTDRISPSAHLAHPLLAVLLVGLIAAIVFVVASPSGCNALAISAFKFGLGTFAIPIFTHHLELVAAVPAVVREVAQPLLRHASVVGTLEVHVGIAFRAALRTLVGTIATVIFTVAE